MQIKHRMSDLRFEVSANRSQEVEVRESQFRLYRMYHMALLLLPWWSHLQLLRSQLNEELRQCKEREAGLQDEYVSGYV